MEILVVLLIFFWCFSKYDVTFKITNRLKVNNNNFKSHITVMRILKKYLVFFIYIYIIN